MWDFPREVIAMGGTHLNSSELDKIFAMQPILVSRRACAALAPAGSTQSLKGAPLRKAPGLRASTGT
jgi:hypothetical protein